MNVKNNSITHCEYCSVRGEILYSHLKDECHGTNGEWGFLRCPKCGLLWLDPRPTKDTFSSIYADTYYTHHAQQQKKEGILEAIIHSILMTRKGYQSIKKDKPLLWAGILLGYIPFFKDLALRRVLYVEGPPSGKLLDIGCGSGWFLQNLQEMGWKNLCGIETDEKAANEAKKSGLKIIAKPIEESGIAPSSVDIITARHVIEHIDKSTSFLRHCYNALKPNGKLILITPNAESLNHKLFKQYWRELDVPRHFFIFSAPVLKKIAEDAGFHIERIKTMTPASYNIRRASKLLKKGKNSATSSLRFISSVNNAAFLLLEECLRMFFPFIGEEILFIARKPK